MFLFQTNGDYLFTVDRWQEEPQWEMWESSEGTETGGQKIPG